MFEIAEQSLAGVSPRNPREQMRERLAERGLTASPSLPNFIKPQLYRDALARLAEANGAKRNSAALVIPDYAARMAVLDFEQFPAGEPERLSLLRFRLRKTVPFHIEEAQLGYSVQQEKTGRVEILAVAIARPILREYEGIFLDAGLRVGLVIPSLIASLPYCEASLKGITLLAKLTASTLSIALIDQGRVRLVRCLDLSGEPPAGAGQVSPAVRPMLQQTLAFAEDQLEYPVTRVLLCGFGGDAEVTGEYMEREFGIPCAPVSSRFGAALPENAGMLGLLEQYAA